MDEFIEDRFKAIVRYFHKAIDSFDAEDIARFRTEIKKLKVFLHLLSMESDDGFSYRITKKLKTIYGYMGVVQNSQRQLKKTKEYLAKNDGDIPVHYLNMLEKELAFWKKTSKDFIDADYNFLDDKEAIVAALPDKLTQKSIREFIHYTLFELQSIAGNSDDYVLESTRKFMEDIYYNYPFIKPFITEQQTNLFDEKAISECMELFGDFREKCTSLALLQTYNADKSDETEKRLLQKMENDWLHEKKELKNQLSAKLDSLHIKANNLEAYAFREALND